MNPSNTLLTHGEIRDKRGTTFVHLAIFTLLVMIDINQPCQQYKRQTTLGYWRAKCNDPEHLCQVLAVDNWISSINRCNFSHGKGTDSIERRDMIAPNDRPTGDIPDIEEVTSSRDNI
jgi:hypothetical protein